jgi:hypothetical protein
MVEDDKKGKKKIITDVVGESGSWPDLDPDFDDQKLGEKF